MGHLSMAGKEKEMLESEGDVRECRQKEFKKAWKEKGGRQIGMVVWRSFFFFWGASMVCRKGEHPFWVRTCSV
jgi:hypothetical protein